MGLTDELSFLILAATPSGGQSIGLLMLGIVMVLALIIGLKLNAFLALFISALAVSLGVGLITQQNLGGRLDAVVTAFGGSAGGVGIAIAMAAIIGKCMLDSGAADRIVRFAVGVTGEAKASLGLMVSGFVLAVPVFFDTVFYLLVPLARSLHRRTGRNYLRYLMAIATGGAITHTLVPPTPGPLLVAATLGVDVGTMMLVGSLVAIPAAVAGLSLSYFVDFKMPVPMRPTGSATGGQAGHDASEQRTAGDGNIDLNDAAGDGTRPPLHPDHLPSLGVSLLPVLIPVLLIGAGTLATTIADNEDRAKLTVEQVNDFENLVDQINADTDGPLSRLVGPDGDDAGSILRTVPVDASARATYVDQINDRLIERRDWYDPVVFSGVLIDPVATRLIDADATRMKPVDRRRMNRLLLENVVGDAIKPHQWESPSRRLAGRLSLWSNANFALTLAALVALATLKRSRRLSWTSLGHDTEEALMSGGIIILITAAGGAFGAMLKDTNISETIRQGFATAGTDGAVAGSVAGGAGLLFLGWSIAAVLKIAQGSSTVAMIVAAGMMSAIIGDIKPDYHMVYVATAVGTGSLMGSWMNDSGFWVFTKMGGLTESESLRSWTVLLATLSISGLLSSVVLSLLLPLR